MISAIVLTLGEGEAPANAREVAVRSLTWLVTAVVSGVVRDVVMACAPSWSVADIMEQAGCDLVVAEREPNRIAAGAARAKCERVLLLRVGLQPEGPIVDELGAIAGRSGFERKIGRAHV